MSSVDHQGSSLKPDSHPIDFLWSDSSSEGEAGSVRSVVVVDQGRCAQIKIAGVPVYGIIDSGADITIIGGELFKRVASGARLRKKGFKKADKVPRTYSQQPFVLDGRMDLDVTFGDKKMKTPIYIKMDAHDQLLLSEGVCHQLGIISYHPQVEVWRGRKSVSCPRVEAGHSTEANVPRVTVKLVKSVRLPSNQGAVVPVRILGEDIDFSKPLYLVQTPSEQGNTTFTVEDSLIQPDLDGVAHVVVSNAGRGTQLLQEDHVLGEACSAEVVDSPGEPTSDLVVSTVYTQEDSSRRQEKLSEGS